MKFVALPDGRRVDLEGSSYTLENNQTLAVNTNGCCSDPKMYRFTAVTPGDAYVLIQAIDNFVSGSANISPVPVSSGGLPPTLEFFSVTPNTLPYTTPAGYSLTVKGNFYNLFSYNTAVIYKSDTNTYGPVSSPNYIDTHTAFIYTPSLPVPDIYTIYYDPSLFTNGAYTDYVSTGLTITVTP